MKELISQRLKEIWREQGLNPDSYSHAVGQAMAVYAEEYASSLQSKGKTKEELRAYFESTGYSAWINADLYPDDKIYTQEYTEWLEKQVLSMESHANKDGCKAIPYQCCPVCNGSGQMYEPISSGTFRPCPTCEGRKIIPMYANQQPEANKDGWVRELSKSEKSALEWLLIKGMEITKSNTKHMIFDNMLQKLQS